MDSKADLYLKRAETEINEAEILFEISGSKEKALALAKRHFGMLKETTTPEIDKEVLSIKLPFLPIQEINEAKHLFARQAMNAMPEIRKVRFVEEMERQEKKELDEHEETAENGKETRKKQGLKT